MISCERLFIELVGLKSGGDFLYSSPDMVFDVIENYSSFERSGQDIEIVLTGSGNQSIHPEIELFLDRMYKLGYKSIILDARNTNTFNGIKKIAKFIQQNPEILRVFSFYHDSKRVTKAIQYLIPGIRLSKKPEYKRVICQYANKSITIKSTGKIFVCPINSNKDVELKANAFIDSTFAYIYKDDIEKRLNLSSGKPEDSCKRFCNGNI